MSDSLYEAQALAAKYRAERDLARQELDLMRPAFEWVDEHGGLEKIRQQRRDSIPRAAYERKRGKLLKHIAGCETALGKRKKRVEELEAEAESLRKRIGAMRPRLMPEGMEWLRYDMGEPVPLGGEVKVTVHDEDGDFDRTFAIRSIKYEEDGVLLEGTENEMVILALGERVKRPKVLAADNEPLEVGQTVWFVEDGDDCDVAEISRDGRVRIEYFDGSGSWHDASEFTHQRPVLDADGVLIKKGDTVYGIETGSELVVDAFVEDGSHGPYTVDCHFAVGGEPNYYRPDKLTHTKPEPQDSWERIEEDAAMQPYAYCVGNGLFEECDEIDTIPTNELFARDLVRRCKALAERGE